MNELINLIIEGIQDKKGHQVVVCHLENIDEAICRAMVIATGNNPSQVQAIVENVKDRCRQELNQRPAAMDGMRNAEWVAMDYGDVMVHVFLPQAREHYDLEHLWADAPVTEIADVD